MRAKYQRFSRRLCKSMDASALGAFGVAFVAGLLSILSPCVLPLLPLVLGAAAAEHRYAPALLALGVPLSFVAIGLFMRRSASPSGSMEIRCGSSRRLC